MKLMTSDALRKIFGCRYEFAAKYKTEERNDFGCTTFGIITSGASS